MARVSRMLQDFVWYFFRLGFVLDIALPIEEQKEFKLGYIVRSLSIEEQKN